MFVNRVISGLALVALPAVTGASEVSGAVTLASEYVYRGQAMSGHDPAFSAGLNYEHVSGFFAGVWGSTIDLDNSFGTRDTEIDYYLGYHFEPTGPVQMSLSLIRYTYPGHEGRRDYEHTEGAIAAQLFERYSVEFAYTDDVYGSGAPARFWAVRGEWPLASYWIAGAGLGVVDLSAINTERYAYWDAGLSTRWTSLVFDLRWHGNDAIEGTLRNWSAGSRIVASLTYGF